MRQIFIIVLLISNLLSLETHDTNNTSKESLGLLKASLSDKKIDEFIAHSKTYLQNIDSSKHKEQLEKLLNTSTQRASELAADALMQLYCSKEETSKMCQRCLYWTKIAQDESFNIKSALGVTYRLNIQKRNAEKGFASAVAISSDGLLVSAFHNIESYESIVAVDHNKQEHNATLLFVSKEDDLAFLQIDVKDIIYAKLAKEKPELGDDIYVLSAEPLLLKGIISKIKNDGFMLNIEIPKGSSGGGIFNTKNELIAIALHKDYLDKTSYGVSTTLFKNVKNEYLPSNQLKSLQGNNYDYSHCEDERDLAIWNKHTKSSQLEIQEFHALFIGLCEKVKNRDLTTEQAQLIFENSRNRLFGKE